jgi:hypothetical protein
MDALGLLIRIDMLRWQRYAEDKKKYDMPLNQEPEVTLPLGCVAFFKESAWSSARFYKRHKKKRLAHPGLSLSSNSLRVAFGTSQMGERDFSSNKVFLLKSEDCRILKKDAVFLLNNTLELSVFDVDCRLDDFAEISAEAMKRLEEKLKHDN